MLVLNVCSGGAAQNRGGLASLDLAQMLVSPSQLVSALDRLDVEAARTAAGSILNWGNAALYT